MITFILFSPPESQVSLRADSGICACPVSMGTVLRWLPVCAQQLVQRDGEITNAYAGRVIYGIRDGGGANNTNLADALNTLSPGCLLSSFISILTS